MEKEPKIKFINMAANAIKYEESPSYGGTDKYIKFGADNQFDKYLYSIAQRSALHAGLLDLKTKKDTGEGLSWNENNKKMNEFYSSLSKDILQKTFTDLEVIGGYFYGIKWYKGAIVSVEYVPFDYCRLGEPNEEDEITNILVSKNWKKANTEKHKPVSVPAFCGKYQGNDYEIAHIFKYTPGQWYPTPTYFAAINWLESDWAFSKFSLSNILNSFNPGMMVVLTEGEPSPEKQMAIEAELKKNSNPEGAGKFILYYANNKEEAPIITPIDVSSLDKQYLAVNDIITEKTLIAHSTPRILANVEKSGSLGGSKEIVQANEIFMQNYVIPQQKIVLDFFNQINEINGITEDVEIEQSKVQNIALLINMLTEVKEFFSADEVRALFGFEPKVEPTTPAPTTPELPIN